MNKNKIAIVINSSWAAYNFRLNLARSLQSNDYEVIFIAPYDNKYSELLKKEFQFINLNIDSSGINPIEDIILMIEMYKVYKKNNLDMVLNFSIKPNIYSSIVSKLLGIKSINNISGLGTLFIRQSIITKIAKLLYKVSLKCTTKIFFQNSDDFNLFVNNNLVNKEKCDLLPGSGVDINKFVPIKCINNRVIKFLLIARVIADKGIYEYIDAIKLLKGKGYHVEFQLLGELGVDNKTAISKKEVDEWINNGYINYLGSTDNVKQFIENMDCVVLPSYREGTPRSLLEAAAMEKPIVTTNVVGCKEVVDDGINGYLCEVKNSQDLASKMEMMINLSSEKREIMGKEGRKKIINEFDEKIVINKYLETIKEIEKS